MLINHRTDGTNSAIFLIYLAKFRRDIVGLEEVA